MKKVKIEIGRRLFMILVACFLLVGLLSFSYAASNNGKNKFMYHGIEEIDGLEEYVKSVVEEILSQNFKNEVCNESALVFASDVAEKPGFQDIILPDSCFSLKGCTIVQQVINVKGVYKWTSYTFNQDRSSGKWFSSYNKNGALVNGDKTSSQIIAPQASGQIAVVDDYSKTEILRDKITIRDTSTTYGQKVYLC